MLTSQSVSSLIRVRNFLRFLMREKFVSGNESNQLLIASLVIDKVVSRILEFQPSLFDEDNEVLTDDIPQ